MRIICIPYHDWRKIEKGGFRTRDAHMIEHLEKREDVEKILVINRPIPLLELAVIKKGARVTGKVVFRGRGFRVHQVSPKIFVLDTFFPQVILPARLKKGWFFRFFGHPRVVSAVHRTLEWMEFEPDVLLSQNIFAFDLYRQLSAPVKVFDAWDNFLHFPGHDYIREETRNAYASYAATSTFWITNSEKNMSFYRENYRQERCDLIRNGVDTEKFEKSYPVPEDLKPIKHPVVGFGGRITHLFDFDLYNYAAAENPEKSFVIIGEILDQKVFDNIKKRDNVHYLGDKSYQAYPAYITNFDMGVIPYVTNDLEHGADSIKAYEYLAGRLEVVATSGGGTDSISSHIKIGKTREAFSDLIRNSRFDRNTRREIPESGKWSSKVDHLLQLIRAARRD